MVSDAKLGVVTQTFEFRGNGIEVGLCFELAYEGNDLLNRFEAYRSANGIELPNIGDMPEESEDDVTDAAEATKNQTEAPQYIKSFAASLPEDHLEQFTGASNDEQ